MHHKLYKLTDQGGVSSTPGLVLKQGEKEMYNEVTFLNETKFAFDSQPHSGSVLIDTLWPRLWLLPTCGSPS